MHGKHILLGITGGIAAYKLTFLIRLLKKCGAEVKCIMTPAAKDFISPLVVSTLSENPVGIEFWNKDDGTWANHVEYGLWADLFVIAPLTVNTLSKMSTGNCDNLLLATYLSMKTSTLVVPAMDLDMYAHQTTKRNLAQLKADGVIIVPAEEGELASGLTGEGRMAEPETIFSEIEKIIGNSKADFFEQNILITAGPTHELLDPVRFIGNYSSGKMGYAIAEELIERGANVTLISGPTNLTIKYNRLRKIDVNSAEEMFDAVKSVWHDSTIGIFSAAVADYRPKNRGTEKIKKKSDELTIELIKNPDILKWAGANKGKNQTLIGFALETQNMKENASVKLNAKNLNMIVMNSLKDKGAGFGHETNKISILDNRNNYKAFKLKSKRAVAKDILNYLKTYIG
ncbi:bifunctional phosphopantothenoylcysteine decarboxylase/phosphopantothenate--cysteine ligase CoaBC [Crocinitomicaceae bacterium]|nr:bifunctional phosphopantothenoylcysteine decarboxylase/phosphopantothenate--cysteine ligase CoaBC [Crocinitomicaceae bacterium]MDB4324244.1 bifunctional phosphopantothenoylcysteine decarboxylase/phosphopantothenate--cysteine ligase CoaBC [Crocinitomicaceae bacterium]